MQRCIGKESAHLHTTPPSPTPLPSRDAEPYCIEHGAGYSTFTHHSQGLMQTVQVFVAPDAPIKLVRVTLRNDWDRPRRLTVTYYAEWVLGVDRDESQSYIVPSFDHELGALFAQNAYNAEFGERVAFLAANKAPHGLTADRTEFLGRLGDLQQPAALGRVGLASHMQAGLDPCAALQLHVDLLPGAEETLCFMIGQDRDLPASRALIQRFQQAEQVENTWRAVHEQWDALLGTVTVSTPDPAMNLMLNRWLLYQALACRVWGRTGFYQSSGAYGYRDQLQDVMALLHSAPQIAREHILRAAQQQFEAGDVLHWWHPPSGRGVRTRISDDMLWLPYVVAEYVETTGDAAILDEKLAFLQADPLRNGEDERYAQYPVTPATYTLYEHCQRAIRRGATQGAHGLPLMGTGDWNDGMNRVGAAGRGESIWLGWFVFSVLQRFSRLSDRRGDAEQANRFRQQAATLQMALDRSTWDGRWYLRAFYDDGTPLGSSRSSEAQIDSIAQSWAVLSGAGRSDRNWSAMAAVGERLVRTQDRLVLLLDPPFAGAAENTSSATMPDNAALALPVTNSTVPQPGYIAGYPPGIRENGGQYTHGATWVIWACAQLGQGSEANRLFQMLNPICHADSAKAISTYRVEPYVVVADIYSVAPHIGRGGWTWYTGSAAWLYRVGLEAILGLRRAGSSLLIDPCIAADWPGFALTYRDGQTRYHIQVNNPHHVERGVQRILLDGQLVPDGRIPLTGDGQPHEVQVELGV